MGADLYRIKNPPKIWGFERSKRAIDDGYFRDAYNEGSILWKYGLSWWRDIAQLGNKKGMMSLAKVKQFRKLIADNEKVFEKNLKGESEENKRYFREGAKLLKEYLDNTIEMKSGIEASL